MRNLPSGKWVVQRRTDKPRSAFRISLRLMTYLAVIGVLLSVVPLAESQSRAPRLQGQVPLADQLSGRALQGYTKTSGS
jgi:hypothetical protein